MLSTCDSRPLVSMMPQVDGNKVCFGSVCTPNVLPPGTRALLPHSSTDSDRYTGSATIRDQRMVGPISFLGVCYLPYISHGVCNVQILYQNLLLACGNTKAGIPYTYIHKFELCYFKISSLVNIFAKSVKQ